MELLDREQEQLANNIEIANPKQEVKTLLILSSLSLKNLAWSWTSGTLWGRSAQDLSALRPLTVRLARRSTRDIVLTAARARRLFTTCGMGMSGAATPFYVNERLTKHNRELFYKTCELANQLKWKYMWTRDGKVFARQEHGKASHRFRMDTDFVRVFGVQFVSTKPDGH